MRIIATVLLSLFSIHGTAQAIVKGSNEPAKFILHSTDIRIRDPFILADASSKTYYMYASIDNRTGEEGRGVEVYSSLDLVHWTAPEKVFKVPEDFWATKWVWAPEVHNYQGKYYLFVTFTSNDLLEKPPEKPPLKSWPPYYKRGTQILYSDSPRGPFIPFANKPHVQADWMTLDGTFWIEKDQPYMVYCHEWVQIKDGTIDLVPLKEDLSETAGPSRILFHASEATWVQPIAQGKGYITDGCFIYKGRSERLFMIWSSNGEEGYAIGTAISASGSIYGPWVQQPEPVFKKNGGHGMIFRTFQDQLMLVLHQPNSSPKERMKLFVLTDTDNLLEIAGEWNDQ